MDIPKIKLIKKFLFLPKTNIAKEIFMKLKKIDSVSIVFENEV